MFFLQFRLILNYFVAYQIILKIIIIINILEVRNIIPKSLNLFDEFKVQTRWVNVEFLFSKNNKELNLNTLKLKPAYDNIHFSPYNYTKESSFLDDNCHFRLRRGLINAS